MINLLLVTEDRNYVETIKQYLDFSRYQLIFADHFDQMVRELNAQMISLAIIDSQIRQKTEIYEVLKFKYPNVIQVGIDNCDQPRRHFMPVDLGFSKIQLSKSVSVSELLCMIDKIVKIDEKIHNRQLINLVSGLTSLPTIPKIYFRMNEMIKNNESIDDIARVIEEDPSTTTSILKMANTAFYNAKTASIRQAIMYIGLINVKNIILTTAVFDNFKMDIETRELHWKQMALTNRMLNAFYLECQNKPLDNNISAVGLLHNVGSIVFMSNYANLFDVINETVQGNAESSFYALEKEKIGFNHDEIGGYLLDLWGFPYPVVEAALYHHSPLSGHIINKKLVMAVHLMNCYSWKALDNHNKFYELDVRVFDELEITQNQFESFYSLFIKKALG